MTDEERENALRGPDVIDKNFIEEEDESKKKEKEFKMIKKQIEDARKL